MAEFTPEFEQYWTGLDPQKYTGGKTPQNKALQFEQFQTMGPPSGFEYKPPTVKKPPASEKKDMFGLTPSDRKALGAGNYKTVLDGKGGRTVMTQDGEVIGSLEDFRAGKTGTTPTQTGGLSGDEQFAVDSLKANDAYLATQEQQATNAMANYQQDLDKEFVGIATAITENYKQRFADLRQMNKAIKGNVTTAQMRTGRARYAPELAIGNISAEESAGQKRIGQLTADMNEEIRMAQAEARKGAQADLLLLNDNMDRIRSLQEDRKQNALDLLALSRERQQDVADKAKAALENQQVELDIQLKQKELDAQEAQEPLAYSPGTSLYDPETLEFLGTVPEPETREKAQIVKGDNGRIYKYDPNTDSMDLLVDTDTVGLTDNAISWANSIASGIAKLSDITGQGSTELKGQVLSLMNKMPPNPDYVKKVQGKISTLEEIFRDYDGQIKAVGANKFARTNFDLWSFDDNARRNNFIGTVQNLVSQEALQSLIDAKASGATFGALSDKELQILTEAATKIGSWARDKKGNSPASPQFNGTIAYYEIDGESFRKEINRLKTRYENALSESAPKTDTREQSLSQFYIDNPNKRGALEAIENGVNSYTGQPFTDDEKQQLYELQGITFSGDLGKSENYLKQYGNITAYGSSVWDKGLDVDLAVGDPVSSPSSGRVAFAGVNKGFGNQVKIKLDDGNEVWLSHLDSINVKEGQRVFSGMNIGKGGKTGTVIPMGGGDGSHLDITMKDKQGKYFSPYEVESYLS